MSETGLGTPKSSLPRLRQGSEYENLFSLTLPGKGISHLEIGLDNTSAGRVHFCRAGLYNGMYANPVLFTRSSGSKADHDCSGNEIANLLNG